LRFRERARQRWTRCGGVLVRPDAWHEVDARQSDVLIGFVDSESDLGAALAARTRADVSPMGSRTIAEWRAQLGQPAALTARRVEPWVTETLLRDRRPAPLDHRIKRVLKILPSRLADAESVSLEAVAATVNLSPSRFMHLFTTSVGVPLRPYVLWLRLQSGFADAAHFTRTFRRMLGATPRQILRRGLAARDFHVRVN
jgi:AraC-like DNA-binding protein